MYVVTFIKNIIFIYIIFFSRLIESNKVMSKEEVLKLKNQYDTEYYCKDDICALVENNYNDFFIDIPDINGNSTQYIVYTCDYENIDLNQCFDSHYIDNVQYFLNCTDDSQCISDKCYKNHCAYNDETSTVHCVDIYSYDLHEGGSSYMNCGKPPSYSCKKDDECSSKYCSASHHCVVRNTGPSDSDSTQPLIKYIATIAIVTIIIIIVIILTVCGICCYIRKRKN